MVVGRGRLADRFSGSRNSTSGSGTAAEEVDDGRVEERLVQTDEHVEDRHPVDMLWLQLSISSVCRAVERPTVSGSPF